jgi:ABC-type multidrug transport system fused ATPase/permease subunit
LFNNTITYNIAYLEEDRTFSDAQINEAADQANATEFISELKEVDEKKIS